MKKSRKSNTLQKRGLVFKLATAVKRARNGYSWAVFDEHRISFRKRNKGKELVI